MYHSQGRDFASALDNVQSGDLFDENASSSGLGDNQRSKTPLHSPDSLIWYVQNAPG